MQKKKKSLQETKALCCSILTWSSLGHIKPKEQLMCKCIKTGESCQAIRVELMIWTGSCQDCQTLVVILCVALWPLTSVRSCCTAHLCHDTVPSSRQQVQEDQLSAVVDWLTAQPRAAQLVDKDSSVVSTLEYHLGHYLKDVKRHYVKADKRQRKHRIRTEKKIHAILFNYVSFICSLIYTQESDFLNSTFPETTHLIYIIVHGHLSNFILHDGKNCLSVVIRDPEFVFYDQLKQTMNAYRCV